MADLTSLWAVSASDVENPNSGAEGLRWHQALAWAVTGHAHPELGEQPRPDLPALAERLLAAPGARQEIEERRAAQRDRGATPPAVPSELMAGLGAAQFTAALTGLRQRLGSGDGPTFRPVLSSRPPDAAERRLLEDVPPHHGG